ncbi:hypothetical protein IC229_14480 [Spirosoma sp. BT702]|uniref:Uncharacterized protein n=1 Tax=Spirosoma profusum TaxID=2771354 RepID=A0A926Y1I3_9BACT|nr:hypothetical protein [Spirosoma profusum]MBD2701853.1 hypothetical protein [Spirosoma profusum]
MMFYQIKKELWRQGDTNRKTYPSAYLEIGMQGYEFLHKVDNDSEAENSNKFRPYYLPDNVPVFDYFVLKQLYADRKRKYDWILLDVYSTALSKTFLIINDGLLVSEKFKNIFESFKVPHHKFYPAFLMYKGNKLRYYLFRMGEESIPDFAESTYKIQTITEESDNIFL